MDFDAIRQRYRDFVDWNKDNIEERITRTAGEYAYYQTLYIQVSKKKNELEQKLDEMWHGKWKYYKYEFDVALDKSEIKGFIDKDIDMIKLRGQISNHESYENFFKECMKNIDQLRWDMKHYIQYKQFMAGIS